MSATNRSISRWSSSTKSSSSNSQSTSLPTVRKKPSNNQQPSFAQRMAKTKHDVEQLFKFYYSTNVKFDTFQRQVVTGTRIASPQVPILTHEHFMRHSSNAFRSKHCVSREDGNPTEIDEHQIINEESELLPNKRTVEVRIDHHPILSPSSDAEMNTLENHSLSTELNESMLLKSMEPSEDFPTDSFVPSSTLSLLTSRKDLLDASRSSFSTVNSIKPTSSPAQQSSFVNDHQRNQSRASNELNQLRNIQTSRPVRYGQPGLPINLGARVVSIPSKCSRYVLVTLPQVPVRYNAPTYVERLLLPERFPALFQNIVQHRNNK